jgi:hypothetical protein
MNILCSGQYWDRTSYRCNFERLLLIEKFVFSIQNHHDSTQIVSLRGNMEFERNNLIGDELVEIGLELGHLN